MKRAILTILGSGLLAACGGDFDPELDGSTDDGNPTMADGDDDDGTEDDTGDETGDETDDDGTADETDSSDDTDTHTDTGTDSGEPAENPKPGEICDPFLAFDGTAPCADDPDEDWARFTCVPVMTEPLPGETQWDFRCIIVRDSQSDGYDIGDPCGDGGNEGAGCMNSSCTGNGLGNDPDNDPYVDHPPGACPFGSADTYYVRACCTPFCDADHPCDPGWSCRMMGPVDGIGFCVWV